MKDLPPAFARIGVQMAEYVDHFPDFPAMPLDQAAKERYLADIGQSMDWTAEDILRNEG